MPSSLTPRLQLSNAEKAETALRLVREAPVIAYDTEGSGLDWTENFPIGYVVTVPELSVYVPTRHGGGGNLPDKNVKIPTSPTDPYVQHKFEKELAKAFEDRRRLGLKIIGHHLKFDCHMSANVGIMLGRALTDTQNRETLLDEYAKKYSLEASAERRKVTAKKSVVMYEHLANLFGIPNDKQSMGHFWRTAGDDPIAVDYAEGDGITTLELYDKQQVLIEEEGLGVVDNLENELIWTLFRLERKGIKVDDKYLGELADRLDTQIAQIEAKLPDGFNPRSPIQMQKYIEGAGRTDWPTTALGSPSFTEKWLKTFPEGKLVVDLRKKTNMKNTFIIPLSTEHFVNGRVHANLNQLKTDEFGTAARLSCSDPNLQQVPKHDKELAPLFRLGFIADEGFDFYEADYSQCEPRLFAHYSKDVNLVAGYSQVPFRDAHQVVADLLKVERDPTAKRMNMGIFTGMYPKTFAAHMGWDIETATEKWNLWFEMFPAVRDFQETASRLIKQRGYVKTLLGRRGRLDNPRFAYKATSKIIQGGNADILKWKLVELDKFCEAIEEYIQLLMTVHDSIEWQAEKSTRGEKASQEILRIMNEVQGEPFNLRVPFSVDVHNGATWAHATFGDKLEKLLEAA